MDKKQAEQALAIIRGVIENTREDLVAHNWGLIWLIHAFVNAAGFAAIGAFIERAGRPIVWYFVPLAVVAGVNLAIVLALVDRDRGVRSFIEFQLHGIWTTFILFSLAIAAVLHIAGAPPRMFGPLIAATSGIGFAMMGVLFAPPFFGLSAAFLIVAFVAALPGSAVVQWYLIAAVWWVAMFVPGVLFFRERQRRLRDPHQTRVL